MKAHIYNVETNEVAVTITGGDNAAIEAEFSRQNYDQDLFGLSYSSVGLIQTVDTAFVTV